jgi:hypothetical protein
MRRSSKAPPAREDSDAAVLDRNEIRFETRPHAVSMSVAAP